MLKAKRKKRAHKLYRARMRRRLFRQRVIRKKVRRKYTFRRRLHNQLLLLFYKVRALRGVMATTFANDRATRVASDIKLLQISFKYLKAGMVGTRGKVKALKKRVKAKRNRFYSSKRKRKSKNKRLMRNRRKRRIYARVTRFVRLGRIGIRTTSKLRYPKKRKRVLVKRQWQYLVHILNRRRKGQKVRSPWIRRRRKRSLRKLTRRWMPYRHRPKYYYTRARLFTSYKRRHSWLLLKKKGKFLSRRYFRRSIIKGRFFKLLKRAYKRYRKVHARRRFFRPRRSYRVRRIYTPYKVLFRKRGLKRQYRILVLRRKRKGLYRSYQKLRRSLLPRILNTYLRELLQYERQRPEFLRKRRFERSLPNLRRLLYVSIQARKKRKQNLIRARKLGRKTKAYFAAINSYVRMDKSVENQHKAVKRAERRTKIRAAFRARAKVVKRKR